MINQFPFYLQLDKMDCGPTCLKMICSHYGLDIDISKLRNICNRNIDGVSLNDIAEGAEKVNFKTMAAYFEADALSRVPLPAIIHWDQNHFVVLYKVTKKHLFIADPGYGKIQLTFEEFFKRSLSTKVNGKDQGLVLLLEPLGSFDDAEFEASADKTTVFYFFKYFIPFKKYFPQIFLTILINMGIAFCFPFFSQSIIDTGFGESNYGFIILILISQLILSFSQMIVNFIKSRLFLHIGQRIGINLLSDFLKVLLKKPFTYFETKSIGDLTNRMGDQTNIQDFLTTSSIIIIFSTVEFFVYSILLSGYNIYIFLIFIAGNILFVIWNILFLKKRRKFNYIGFNQSADNQNITYDMLNGIYEIKMQNCELEQRWKWEEQQVKQFKFSIKSLNLSQFQEVGSFFLDRVKNLSISVIVCGLVIKGEMTLGVMMSISYIMGQLQGPINAFSSLIGSYQNAKISLERIQEVHETESTETEEDEVIDENDIFDIEVNNLTFKYDKSSLGKNILKDICCIIPAGKTTAIVGESGSGKSTLVKLLLKIYETDEQSVILNKIPLGSIKEKSWRSICGVVSQEGYIFSDTIAKNIGISSAEVDVSRLLVAAKAANIHDHIESLPLKYNTKIGKEGRKFSQGQTQRLLIARLLYKNPNYIFLDEATNSLDSENESIILNNINETFSSKTKVIIAHRLSTIKNADQILVMKNGEIVERGKHSELITRKGYYYKLVKTQLT